MLLSWELRVELPPTQVDALVTRWATERGEYLTPGALRMTAHGALVYITCTPATEAFFRRFFPGFFPLDALGEGADPAMAKASWGRLPGGNT